MHRRNLTRVLITLCLSRAYAQTEPVVLKETISVHRVERGDMPVLKNFSGEIVSLTPPEVSLTAASGADRLPRPGDKAKTQIKPPEVLTGRVVSASPEKPDGPVQVRVRFDQPFPADIRVGEKLGVMIELGELKDIVYFARPAAAHADSETAVFVVDADSQFATRRTVRFGRESGPFIEIVKGLSPGERVIVTDMSRWIEYERVRLK